MRSATIASDSLVGGKRQIAKVKTRSQYKIYNGRMLLEKQTCASVTVAIRYKLNCFKEIVQVQTVGTGEFDLKVSAFAMPVFGAPNKD